jgi:formate C-acetyltransferase
MVCDAAAAFGKRYAVLARELADKEHDPQIKADYLKLADICARVPARSARSFHEAVQSLYFSLLMMLNDAASVSFGRLDQYLYPYLKNDLDEGVITKEEAYELLDCLFIKCSKIQILFSAAAARYATGAKGANMLCVGGLDENGFDATYDLSYMLLQAMCNVRLGQPSVSVLWHPMMPEELAIKALKLSCLDTGHPSIFNTTRLVEMLPDGR